MTRHAPLKIAYLCDASPLDRHFYSGGNTRIYDALRKHGADVTILDTGWHMADPLRTLVRRLPMALEMRLRWRLHLLMSRLISRGVRAELAKGRYDVLFGTYAFQTMSYVTPPYPMVTAFTSDAMPTPYKRSEIGESFGSFFKPARLLDNWMLRQETRVINGLDLALWPSDWLRDGANRFYDMDPSKSLTVPWGANVADPGVDATPPVLTKGGPLHFLLIGRDWFAKGGPLVAETIALLRARGIDARLTVIGCHPPQEHLSDAITVLGLLDKSVPDQLAQFDAALRKAHFIMQPSFESYGFAFCEASAYGLPSLCLRVGGVPVRDGVNGHALPMGSGPDAFADLAASYVSRPEAYKRLRQTSRQEYETRLNWDAWATRTLDLLAERVALLPRKLD